MGTGFASSFFLKKYLETAGSGARILVLERGPAMSHQERIERRAEAEPPETYYRGAGLLDKSWAFSIGFGGSSNCWWGNTPRFIPADFEIASRFGHGRDWPFGYDELEPYYAQTEAIMQIAGTDANYRHPRSAPFPLPPHNQSDPEKVLRAAFPDTFFPMPTARASSTDAVRTRCCANNTCFLCPVDAKFTISNGFADIYRRANVTLVTGAHVHSLEMSAGEVSGVEYTHAGEQKRARASLVVLGANAFFNPLIMHNSGISHAMLGRRLHEQIGIGGEVFLDGMDSFQGSTSVTGIGYMLWEDEERRRDFAPALLETKSCGLMRAETGRWRQVLPIRMVYEDIPEERNFVAPAQDDRDMPVANFVGHSAYAERSAARVEDDLAKILAPLPVESIQVWKLPTESHIQGTTVMGNDPATSVVDAGCISHRHRNLLVLGSSVFPSCSPANPTLTLSALSLRAAARLAA